MRSTEKLIQLKKRIWELIKFAVSSGTGALIDYAVYSILLLVSPLSRTTVFTIGRVCGAVCNFCINKFVVFRGQRTGLKTFLLEVFKYALLWGVMYFGALGLLHLYADMLDINDFLAKPLADATMYVFGFLAQKFLVFRSLLPKDTSNGDDPEA